MDPSEVQKEAQMHHDTVQAHLQNVPPTGQFNHNHLTTILHDVLKALGFFLRLFEAPQPLTNGDTQSIIPNTPPAAPDAGGGTIGGNAGAGAYDTAPGTSVADQKSPDPVPTV